MQHLEFIVMALGYLFEAYIIYDYYKTIFEIKKRFVPTIITYMLAFAGLFGLYYLRNPIINIFAFIIITWILCKFSFRCSKLKALFHALLITALYLLCETIVIPITSIFYNENYAQTGSLLITLYASVGSKLMLFVLCKLIEKAVVKEGHNYSIQIWLLILPIASLFSMTIIYFFSASSERDLVSNIIIVSASVLLLISNLVVFYIYEKSLKTEQAFYELKLLEQKKENDYEYYQILEKHNENSRVLIHDINNHLSIIQSLAKNNNDCDVLKYLSSISTLHNESSPLKLTHNKILDVIFSHMYEKCKENGIKFDVNFSCINLSFINEADICSIFSNLLNNAFEAAEKSKNKTIQVDFSKNAISKHYIVRIINSCDKPPIKRNGKLLTSKASKEQHGMGIVSIQRSLSKYNGDFTSEYYADKNIFESIIIIKAL